MQIDIVERKLMETKMEHGLEESLHQMSSFGYVEHVLKHLKETNIVLIAGKYMLMIILMMDKHGFSVMMNPAKSGFI